MLIKLFPLMKPPQFADDEKNRLAGILHVILLILLGMSAVSITLAFIFSFYITSATLLVGGLFFLLALWLLHIGHINLTAVMTLAVLMAGATYLAYTRQGIFDRALLIFPMIIIIASLILERRLFILITALCVAIPGFLVWAEMSGWISRQYSEHVSLFDFIAVAIIFLVTAGLMRILTTNLQQSLTLAHRNEAALTESNLQLEMQKQALQKSEENARLFQQKLQALHRVSLELAQIDNLPTFYRRAVELGRSELGFDRLGLLLLDEKSGFMQGKYGTNERGEVVNESHIQEPLDHPGMAEITAMKRRVLLLEDVPIYYGGKQVGFGWNALTLLWSGQKNLGWLATDNLVKQEPLQQYQLELLSLYGATLVHQMTRIQSDTAVRISEAEARQFQESLQALHEVSLALAQIETEDELYYQAVQLGLTRLGFERLGLLLLDPETNELIGTYGTDESGAISDERTFRQKLSPESSLWALLKQQKRINVVENADLYVSGKVVGQGWRATSGLWDGQAGIGWLSADNLLSLGQPKAFQLEVLYLYSATLGSLITRKRAEIAITKSEAEARQFQEKLQILHEVSIELAGMESLDVIYRLAVEWGRARLGFDRLGLLLFDEDTQLMVGTFGTDIDGRLRDERQFKQVVHSPEIMAILDSRQRLGFWENAPLWDEEKIVGQGWSAMVVLWNGNKGIGWLATDNLVRGEPPNSTQLEILTLYGNVLGHLVTVKQNEAAIRDYAQELERSNDELQQFAYVSSHDLQEPLRKIQAFGDRFQQRYADVLDERGLDYLRRMQDAASRMQILIQDLLAFSRVGTQTRPFAPVDLADVVTDVLTDLETRFEETKGGIRVAQLPLVEADATQMRQLFQNLISNALKFHRPGVPPEIEIHCNRITDGLDDREFYQIVVADNGIGFEEKYNERIFGMFQRLHGRSEYEGTGVGLAVCRRIVERHHGRITAQSSLGQGSTFTITLPRQQPNSKR